MATIAQTFLDDLDDSDDEELVRGKEVKELQEDEIVDEVEVEDIEIEDISDFEDEDVGPKVETISTLLDDEKLTSHLERMDEVGKKTRKRKRDEQIGKIDMDEEHEIVVRSNELILEIDHHIMLVHQFVTEVYEKKLPELKSMVQNPVEYANCVLLIGDRSSEEMDSLPLAQVLGKKLARMVLVTSTTTLGKPLGEDELSRVTEAAQYLIKLQETKQSMIDYLKSRMEIIAPNTSAICGPEVASQLISLTGGIEHLACMPACNVQVLGSNKALINTILAHHGVIVNCELVQMVRGDHQLTMKALRLVSNKAVLAARIDLNKMGSDQYGRRWYNDCKKKIDKWLEPPPQKPPKPLPIPDKNKARKRGGKRFRKMREKYTPTETQRMAARLGFNVPEDELIVQGEVIGLGMLGRENLINGAIRVHERPFKKDDNKLAKMNQRMIAKQRRKQRQLQEKASAGTVSGFTTSMVFTSVGGIEMGEVQERAKKRLKYFSNITRESKA